MQRIGACICQRFVVLGLSLSLIGANSAAVDPGLVEAARAADWEAVRVLVEQGEDVDQARGGMTALYWASHWGHTETVDLLIGAGADANAADDLGVTPLWTTAERGNVAIAQKLLDAGADPNVRLLSGETSVMTAARAGKVELVTLLLAKARTRTQALHGGRLRSCGRRRSAIREWWRCCSPTVPTCTPARTPGRNAFRG